MLSIFKLKPPQTAKFRVIQEQWMLSKYRFGSDDPNVVAEWLRQNGGYGQKWSTESGLHVRTVRGIVRSGRALDTWIDDHLPGGAARRSN